MATLESIKAQIAKLTKQAQAIESKAVQKVLALMDKLGVSVDDLPQSRGRKAGSSSGSRGRPTVGAPKYRDPTTRKTWTGHGRAPEWIKSAANRDDFLISGATGTGGSAPPVKAARKTRQTAAQKAGRRSTKATTRARETRKTRKSAKSTATAG